MNFYNFHAQPITIHKSSYFFPSPSPSHVSHVWFTWRRSDKYMILPLAFVVGDMEAEDWSCSSGGASDSDAWLEDSKDDEEFVYGTNSPAKLQFRKVVIKARWKDELGMAEVMEHKGRLLTSMGIVRNSKIYCSIEETLFLVEIGALLLVDDKDTTIHLKKIYRKVSEGRSGCSWEGFEVYRHLKSLGYIVGRHGIPWSLKSSRSCSMPRETTSNKVNAIETALDETSIIHLLDDLQIGELKPVFEVFLPNSKFRKTSAGDPSFLVYLCRGHPPSRSNIEKLERQCNGIPLKVVHVDHGRVSFFSFDKVDLPILP